MHGICKLCFATFSDDSEDVVLWCAKGPSPVPCEHPESCKYFTAVRPDCSTIPSAPAEVVLD